MICFEDNVPAQWELIAAQWQARTERDQIASDGCPMEMLSLCADALSDKYQDKGPIWVSLPRRLSAEELHALQLRLNNKGWSFRKSILWRLGDYKLLVGALYNNEAFESLFVLPNVRFFL